MDRPPRQDLLLRSVSRSFYLTLRALPKAVRPQISLAYLLARATDTIADTEAVALARRMDTLALYRERILGRRNEPIPLQDFSANDSASLAERLLLARIEELIETLSRFPPDDQQRIRDVLAVIVSGQELDLQRFGSASSKSIAALQTGDELDDYTWRVAGCVGEFWTRMCRAHVFTVSPAPEEAFLRDGIRFGKGLQLVNILRDVPADLRKGRCYLPARQLAGAGLKPADLLDPANEPRLRPIYDSHLTAAHDHLIAGWNYTNAIPRRYVRLRLACAWPILIAVKTLGRLRLARILEPASRVKVSRADVRGIIASSMMALVWPRSWQRLFTRAAQSPARANPGAS